MTAVTTVNMDGKQKVIKGDYVSHFFVTAVGGVEPVNGKI